MQDANYYHFHIRNEFVLFALIFCLFCSHFSPLLPLWPMATARRQKRMWRKSETELFMSTENTYQEWAKNRINSIRSVVGYVNLLVALMPSARMSCIASIWIHVAICESSYAHFHLSLFRCQCIRRVETWTQRFLFGSRSFCSLLCPLWWRFYIIRQTRIEMMVEDWGE